MSTEEQPLLSYASDAKQKARVDALRTLKWCLLVTAIVYYSMVMTSYFLSGGIAGRVLWIGSFGVQAVLMVFVAWMGIKLQGPLTGWLPRCW